MRRQRRAQKALRALGYVRVATAAERALWCHEDAQLVVAEFWPNATEEEKVEKTAKIALILRGED